MCIGWGGGAFCGLGMNSHTLLYVSWGLHVIVHLRIAVVPRELLCQAVGVSTGEKCRQMGSFLNLLSAKFVLFNSSVTL
jgi:uncharacterized membrane protein